MVAGVHIQFLPKALSGILRGYLIASIVVSVRNIEFETLILNLQLPHWVHCGGIGTPKFIFFLSAKEDQAAFLLWSLSPQFSEIFFLAKYRVVRGG